MKYQKLLTRTPHLFASLFLLLAVTACTPSAPIASWHMINVNFGKLQGDANLLVIGDRVLMIDAGYYQEAKQAVIPYLQKLGITKIDDFFISHPHRDHYEGMAAILDAGIKIDRLYYKIPAPEIRDCCYNKADFLKYVNYAKSQGATLIRPKTGLRLNLPQQSWIEILHAQEGNLPSTRLDINDMSMIMKWHIAGMTVLFPGDLNLGLGRYLSQDQRMRADFMKMPHHGARSLAPNRFLDTVNPDYVLVPGPEWIWCGERGSRPRKWVMKKKIPVWINGTNGTIRVDFGLKQTIITPERVNKACKLQAYGKLIIHRNDSDPSAIPH